MRADVCEEMSRKLVDYSDGELPPDQVQGVADHLAVCPECAKLLKVLDLSLTMTTTLWESALASKPAVRRGRVVKTVTVSPWAWKSVASVAACFAIVVSAAFFWISGPPASGQPPTLAEIKQSIQQSGRAARQLMVAEILASCDDTEEILAHHHRYMAETFPKGL